jgi:glycosyltransferase involved in cell wall biosynthesis
MRVLITTTSLQPAYGGPAFSVSRLALALAHAGLEVAIWSADGSARTTPLLPANDAVRRLGGAARAALADVSPDVLHDNGLWLAHNHEVAVAARARALPRLLSPRGMLEPWAMRHKQWKKRLAWLAYQHRDVDRASALHVTATSEAENIRRLALRPPTRMIPNGMDLPPPRPGGRTDAGRVRTALFLGRLYPVKGLPMLVEAWARVRPANWRLVLAGPDEAGHRARLEKAVAAAGLSDVVTFPGPLLEQAKLEAFHEADLFVLPSHSESFGMAVAEALAHELPVLTTTATPWPWLEERGCGWRVAPNTDAITEGLRVAIAASGQVRRQMGEAGRALIDERFGWPGVAEQFIALYGDLRGSELNRAT